MKTLLPLLLLSAFTGLMGCKKDQPEAKVDYSCNDGSCCNNDKSTYTFLQEFKNEPADVAMLPGGAPATIHFRRKFTVPELADDSSKYKQNANICVRSLSRVQGISNSVEFDASGQAIFPYRYRVWGKLYKPDYWDTNIVPFPILTFYIDRIERVQ